MKTYPPKVCEVCGHPWQPKSRYQSTRNKTCGPACNSTYLSRKAKARPKRPSQKVTLVCPVCGVEFLAYPRTVKRVKMPTCSRRCNGMLRGENWKQHAHKGRAAWTAESHASYREKMSGPNNPAWKGGVMTRRPKGNYIGPVYVRCPEHLTSMARADGYVMEHRLVMATMTGYPLLRTEVVHHLDHMPRHNDPRNLELWPDNRSHKLAEHGRFVTGAACRWFPKDSARR